MSAGSRGIERVRRNIPLKSRIALLEAVVLCHLQNSMTLLISITEFQNKPIDKHIDWGMRIGVFKEKEKRLFLTNPRVKFHPSNYC